MGNQEKKCYKDIGLIWNQFKKEFDSKKNFFTYEFWHNLEKETSFIKISELVSKNQLIKDLWRILVFISSPLIATIVLYALISGILLVSHEWTGFQHTGDWKAFVWIPSLLLMAFSFACVILLGMLGRDSIEGIREWWSRLGAWLLICSFGYLAIVVAAIYGPLLGEKLILESGAGFSISAGWIGTTIAGVLAGKSEVKSKAFSIIAKIAPFIFIVGLFIVISTLIHVVIAKISCDIPEINCYVLPFNFWGSLPLKHWEIMSNSHYWLLFFMSFIVFIVLLWRVDINEFSLNAFYRSRLVRCYLGATRAKRNPQSFTGFDDKDDFNLSELENSNGPLHIINCSLNLGGSKDLSLHSRHSAIFTLTPFFCGSSFEVKGTNLLENCEIGYAPTDKYGGEFDQPTLGQAIAVSGAAVNPNRGYHTSPVTAFLMTLFNVRLGWWFPNPHLSKFDHPSPWFSLKYLLFELFGVANEQDGFLSISDGGHFENLAAYELVKRKCKVIIISDGECDPNYQFESLGNLIRICEVDFGTKIKIDVRSIMPDASTSWGRNRCAVGEIIYDPNNEASNGILIYLKASMTGHEDTAVMQYKAAHPTFPHETTGDQFYSEDQFESYRTLGRDITERTFAPVLWEVDEKGLYNKELKPIDNAEAFTEMAKMLRKIWTPMLSNIGQFSHHTDKLMELWAELGKNQKLNSLDMQLTTGWLKPDEGQKASEDENAVAKDEKDNNFRTEFYFCSELIQLMENVYLDLNLEETWEHPDNEGWRSLFLQWAKSDRFKETWGRTDQNYGLRFRYFCERHLKLPQNKKKDS